MNRIYQWFLMGAVLTLVILGLNISNEAINQLTVSQRPPVIDLQTGASQVEFYLAGQQYAVDGEKLKQVGSIIEPVFEKVVNYLYKIWEIFRIVFLS